MRRRVFVNKEGHIALDSDMYGHRKRLSTNKKPTDRLMKWYKTHFDDEYRKEYERRFGKPDGDPGSLTLQEYGYEVLEATRLRRKERSHETNHRILNELVEWFGKKTEINSITKMKCEQWQNAMLMKFAEKTVKNKRAVLHLVLDYALDEGYIQRNPLSKLPEPKRPKRMGLTELQKKRAPVYWPYEDVIKLIDCASGQDKNIYELAAFSGLRGGELVALRWSKIDFINNIINVDEQIADKEVCLPKFEKTRVASLLPRAREALLRQQKKTGLSDYVFLTQYGEPYTSHDDITRRLEEFCKEIGIDPGGLHDLRRFNNTLLKKLGYQDDFILQHIGHNTMHVNREHYTGELRIDPADFEKRLQIITN